MKECVKITRGYFTRPKNTETEYYWPTMKANAYEFARAYDHSQRYSNFINNPVVKLKPIISPWPFVILEIYLIGELPKRKGGVKYVMVAVDYFTK